MTPADPSRPPVAPSTPAAPHADPGGGHEPAPVDWSEESTAGEEDPGASLDMAVDEPTPQPVPATPPEAPRR